MGSLCGSFCEPTGSQLNGTGWAVQGGRKEGVFSCAEAAENELPLPTFNVSQLIESFAMRGLSKKQMVILSGSHTQLKNDCSQATFNTTLEIFMDTITPGEFDANYYKVLSEHKGLFTSDQSLFDDRRTRNLVKKLKSERRFDHQFGKAMRAMGAVGVRAEGQDRRNCRTVNPW
ncbi:hypothetical protein AXG93_1502s1040 [Marchantia polymorpha subsp. ruderalis]|uniref:Plant heme peroxidase family profile domain-containing protein n=1 Tax=Marchantia polymorpha subsp. ruderalis TaxID=1480154 RepID=A0A176WDL7_MARPO|nr:hypothetical protein AXG93_1502s1040 [Marchantia polymorpha subsp. ruderalis]